MAEVSGRPTTPDALEEARVRLARLDRLTAATLSQFGSLVRLAKVDESTAAGAVDAAVDGARGRAAATSLAVAVEGLLALVEEVKVDAVLQAESSGDQRSPSTEAAAAGATA